MLPEEIRRALGDAAQSTPARAERIEREVRFGAALGGSFGETHVVRADGRWRLFTRASFLDPFREVELSQTQPPRLETQGFRQRLILAQADGGDGILDVGILDQERAQALAREWLQAPGEVPEPAPVSAPRAQPLFATPAPSSMPMPSQPDRGALRQRLVDDLAARATTPIEPAPRSSPFSPSVPSVPSSSSLPSAPPRVRPSYLPSIPLRDPGPSRRAPGPREPPSTPERPAGKGPLFEPWQLAMLVLAALVLAFMVLSRVRGHR